MASLMYTDGSNGNGIKDAHELMFYFHLYPLAMFDIGFMCSYVPLMGNNPTLRAEFVDFGKQLARSNPFLAAAVETWLSELTKFPNLGTYMIIQIQRIG